MFWTVDCLDGKIARAREGWGFLYNYSLNGIVGVRYQLLDDEVV